VVTADGKVVVVVLVVDEVDEVDVVVSPTTVVTAGIVVVVVAADTNAELPKKRNVADTRMIPRARRICPR
jgi:hypothetical protein